MEVEIQIRDGGRIVVQPEMRMSGLMEVCLSMPWSNMLLTPDQAFRLIHALLGAVQEIQTVQQKAANDAKLF